MEAPSPTTSTNSGGERVGVRGAGRVDPGRQPSAHIARLARYIELVDADYLNDDLARVILATLNGPELGDLGAEDRAVLQEPTIKAATAICGWLIDRPDVPLAEIIQAIPRLRSIVPADAWAHRNEAHEAVLDQYRAAKRAFRSGSDPERGGEAWSSSAKRAVLNKLVVDGLREGERAALDNLLRDIAVIGSFFPFTVDPSELTSRMDDGGWYASLSEEDFQHLGRSLVELAPLMSARAVQHVLLFLNFRSSSPFGHNARVDEAVIGPLARRLFALGLHEQAYTAVHWSLIFYGYRLPSETEFAGWVDAFAAASAEAGRRLAPPKRSSTAAPDRPLRLAFITRGGSVSIAAADHILGIMEHLRRDHPEQFQARLYVFDTFDADMEASCRKRGVAVRFVVDEGFGSDRITDKVVRLQQIVAEDGMHVAIWTHAFDLAFFAFGMRMAPLQILFSQYLHPQPANVDVDAYMTWGSPVLREQVFNGRSWRVVPSSLRFEAPDVDDQEIRRLRSTYAGDDTILVGTLARADKVGQPDYLEVIIALLQRHPNVVFLWTGHTEHAEITGAFEKAGVLQQTRFVGWVNITHYSRILDILLDTFPLSNGITALQAMSHGTSILSLATPLSFIGRDIAPAFSLEAPAESRRARLAGRITRLFGNGEEDTFPAARSPDDYLAKASRLIEDAEFRSRYGAALKRTYELVYADEQLMTASFIDRLNEIIDEQATASGPPHGPFGREAAPDGHVVD